MGYVRPMPLASGNPLVSIITPTRLRPDFLRRCILAIQRQEMAEHEHIIVADRCPLSRAVYEEFAEDARIVFAELTTCVCDPILRRTRISHNASCARNLALTLARADVIAYCDDDNVLLPNHTRTALEYLAEHPEVDGLCTQYVHNNWSRSSSYDAVFAADLYDTSFQDGHGTWDTSVFVHRAEVPKRYGFWRPLAEALFGFDRRWALSWGRITRSRLPRSTSVRQWGSWLSLKARSMMRLPVVSEDHELFMWWRRQGARLTTVAVTTCIYHAHRGNVLCHSQGGDEPRLERRRREAYRARLGVAATEVGVLEAASAYGGAASRSLVRRVQRFWGGLRVAAGEIARLIPDLVAVPSWVRTRRRRVRDIHDLELGHLRSMRERAAVDATGRPVPWYTYPAIEFLRQLDLGSFDVLEFGAGNSTAFWAERARRVVSVESDPAWYRRLAADVRDNQTLWLHENCASYVAAPAALEMRFDIVVIDGRWRKSCAEAATRYLKSDGLLVFDNADWFPASCALLRRAGLLQLDLSGFSPINDYRSTTAIFVRAGTRLQEGYRNPLPIGGLDQVGVPEDDYEER